MTVSKLFRAYRLYNDKIGDENKLSNIVSKLFRAYRLYNVAIDVRCEKANVFQSSFELTGYITATLLAVSPREYGFKALSSLQVI